MTFFKVRLPQHAQLPVHAANTFTGSASWHSLNQKQIDPVPNSVLRADNVPLTAQLLMQGSNKVPIGDSVSSIADVPCPTFIVFSGSELSDHLFVFALSHF